MCVTESVPNPSFSLCVCVPPLFGRKTDSEIHSRGCVITRTITPPPWASPSFVPNKGGHTYATKTMTLKYLVDALFHRKKTLSFGVLALSTRCGDNQLANSSDRGCMLTRDFSDPPFSLCVCVPPLFARERSALKFIRGGVLSHAW